MSCSARAPNGSETQPRVQPSWATAALSRGYSSRRVGKPPALVCGGDRFVEPRHRGSRVTAYGEIA